MQYEVEQKYPVADLAALETTLTALGAELQPPQLEVDLYYAHPVRDFAATDEALRIRQVGPNRYITYKGPKIDATTKTRREIELPLISPEPGTPDWGDLLDSLGFTPVTEVRKNRRKATLRWQDRSVLITLDEVFQLGTFSELELMAEKDGLEQAKACIASLAEKLGLTGSERRSYLELLLENG